MSEESNRHVSSISDFLSQSVAYISLQFYTLKQLYTDENSDVLLDFRVSAPLRLFYYSLLDSILLSISRLFDKATVQGLTTASFRTALSQLNLAADDARRTDLESKVLKAKDACRKFLAHRNQRLAHNDYRVNQQVLELPSFSLGDLERVVEQVIEISNSLTWLRDGSTTGFETLRTDTGVAPFLSVLRQGSKAIEEKLSNK